MIDGILLVFGDCQYLSWFLGCYGWVIVAILAARCHSQRWSPVILFRFLLFPVEPFGFTLCQWDCLLGFMMYIPFFAVWFSRFGLGSQFFLFIDGVGFSILFIFRCLLLSLYGLFWARRPRLRYLLSSRSVNREKASAGSVPSMFFVWLVCDAQ